MSNPTDKNIQLLSGGEAVLIDEVGAGLPLHHHVCKGLWTLQKAQRCFARALLLIFAEENENSRKILG